MNIRHETELKLHESVWIVLSKCDEEGNCTFWSSKRIISSIQLTITNHKDEQVVSEGYRLHNEEGNLYHTENAVRQWYNEDCNLLAQEGQDIKLSFFDWLQVETFVVYRSEERANEMAQYFNDVLKNKE